MQQSLFGSFAVSEPVSEKAAEATRKAWANQRLSDAVFTVIDLETTGLSAKKSGITEIVAIQYKLGKDLQMYGSLVKPTEPIPEEVEMLTGITNEMVRQSPAMVMVLSELAAFVGENPVIVGHNVSFDIGFLREKNSQTGLEGFVDRYDLSRAFCTKALAVKALPGLPSYEGIMVATSVGYHNPNPHRAEADVRMSAGILFALIERVCAANPKIQTVQDLMDWQGPL